MTLLTLSGAAAMVNGSLIGDDREFDTVSSDTRSLQPGALFVALKGPNFDGHQFIAAATEKGAAGALVSERQQDLLPAILVEDTRVSLGQLAAGWRQQHPVPLVAVTGSNGKTTVKEMLTTILDQSADVLATHGNLNNDIGMPLTLLRLQDEAYAVLEMGANHPGEIEYLSGIAQPDIAIITNAGAAHLEGFGDLDGVARAKGEILSGLGTAGVAVLNADDPRFSIWQQLAGDRKILTFGFSPSADVRTDPATVQTIWTETGFSTHFMVEVAAGEFAIQLALAGEHNLRNALAAIAAGLELNIGIADIQRGLAALQPVAGRMQTRIAHSGMRVIDDTYNANPDSVAAAIHVLQQASGRRWLILGDLAELGEEAIALHAQVGQLARAAMLDGLWTTGQLCQVASAQFGKGGRHFKDHQALMSALRQELKPEDTVLVKGSRSSGMEQVVAELLDAGGQ